MQGKCKKTGAEAVAEVTPHRPANTTKGRAFRSQRSLKPDD
jgi:hypothetical protein